MTSIPSHEHAIVLAVHPFTRGMGWVVFSGPFSPFDWGIGCPSKDTSRWCRDRLAQLIRQFAPEVLVIENSEGPGIVKAPRIRSLHQDLTGYARAEGLAIAIYARSEVQSCFAAAGAVTRQAIAETIARYLPDLAPLLPPARKKWESQHRYLALFSAAALGLAHYQLEKVTPQQEIIEF